jgi:tRNA threonylcarbamoyladenosine biosynthesis protein TsaB
MDGYYLAPQGHFLRAPSLILFTSSSEIKFGKKMKILASDTSTMSCSVAVVDKTSVLAELTVTTGETHSKHLMRLIRDVIALSDMSISDIDGFAVITGPGTFTGLRIGVSSIKGLAAAHAKPVVGISSLDVLASQSSSASSLICPLIDARRGEVYFAKYRFSRTGDEQRGLIKECKELVLPPAEAVGGINEPCVFTGNGALIYKQDIVDLLGDLAYFAPEYQHTIRASAIAHLGMQRFEMDDSQDVAELVPHYIRKSDAELKFGKTGYH